MANVTWYLHHQKGHMALYMSANYLSIWSCLELRMCWCNSGQKCTFGSSDPILCSFLWQQWVKSTEPWHWSLHCRPKCSLCHEILMWSVNHMPFCICINYLSICMCLGQDMTRFSERTGLLLGHCTYLRCGMIYHAAEMIGSIGGGGRDDSGVGGAIGRVNVRGVPLIITPPLGL